MIIRETAETFVMTRQDDHGRFSGEVARGFRDDILPEGMLREDCLLAIQEHDRCWIRLDAEPIWNDADGVPYTFIDYPVQPKLLLYQIGLEEIESMSKYAALLCSMHFGSFFKSDPASLSDPERAFYQSELERQERLLQELGYPDEQMASRHFRLLQLCDDLSLYVCMNREGASKAEEHPWFRNGFKSLIDGQRYMAEWSGSNKIRLTPFPFESEWSVTMRSKHVSKRRILEVGINRAYQECEWSHLKVTFVR